MNFELGDLVMVKKGIMAIKLSPSPSSVGQSDDGLLIAWSPSIEIIGVFRTVDSVSAIYAGENQLLKSHHDFIINGQVGSISMLSAAAVTLVQPIKETLSA